MKGIINSINDDGTANVAVIDENNSILLHVPFRQNTNSAKDAGGEYSYPSEGDVAILEGPLDNCVVSGVQSVIDDEGKLLNTNERIEPGDKWQIGPDGQKIGLLSGGVIWLFVNALCHIIISKIRNTMTLILENFKLIFPNVSFAIQTDVDKSELSLKFSRDKEVKNDIFINQERASFNINNKVTIIVDTRETEDNRLKIAISEGNSEITVRKDGKFYIKTDNELIHDANLIKLGENASQPLIFAWKLASLFFRHSHPGDHAPPSNVTPSQMQNAFSQKVKVE